MSALSSSEREILEKFMKHLEANQSHEADLIFSKMDPNTAEKILVYRNLTTGDSVLHAICHNGLVSMARTLLSWFTKRYNRSALIVDFLNAKNGNYVTALHEVFADISADTIELGLLLLEAGANPFILNSHQESAFHLACYNGCLDFILAVLRHVSRRQLAHELKARNDDGWTAVAIAKLRGHSAIVQALQNFDASNRAQTATQNLLMSLDRVARTPKTTDLLPHASLHALIGAGDIHQCKMAIEKAKNVNILDENNMTPLFLACNTGQAELVKYLLDCGADPNLADAFDTTPLIVACLRNNVEAAALLLKAGADPNRSSSTNDTELTPLIVAASSDNVTLIQELVQKGARVDFVRRSDDATAITVAWRQSCLEAVRELLIRCPIREEQLALVYHDSSLEVLLEILHTALLSEFTPQHAPLWSLVSVIVARVNSASQQGNEELSNASFVLRNTLQDLLPVAAIRRDLEMVVMLLHRHKCDPNRPITIQNSHWKDIHAPSTGSAPPTTLLMLALHLQDMELLHILLDHGANPNHPAGAIWPLQYIVDHFSEPTPLKVILLHPDVSLHSSFAINTRRERLIRTLQERRKAKWLHLILAAGAATYRLPQFEAADAVLPNSDFGSYNERCRVERDLSNFALTSAQLPHLLALEFGNVAMFNISGNPLQQFELPQSATRFEVLHTLQLHGCGLFNIPARLDLLKSLTSLDVSHNLITTLQSMVAENACTTLRLLNIRENPLSSLPLQLYKLQSLQKLEFDVQRLTQSGIPEAVLKLPTPSLLAYLRAVTEKPIYWNQAKVLVVGEDNVGKTTVIRHLMSGEALGLNRSNSSEQSHSLSTDGIDITEWECLSATEKPWRFYCSTCLTFFSPDSVPSSGTSKFLLKKSSPHCPSCINGTLIADSLHLSFWDFGGQTVFYPSHQLFLSDRSIYVLVFNLSKVDEARIEYWLRQINSIATSRPPIILLGTHRDRCHESRVLSTIKEFEDRFRQQWCGNVRSILFISASSKSSITDFRRILVDTAQSMLSSLSVPAYYLSLKQLLLTMKLEPGEHDYISLPTLRQRVIEKVPPLASRPLAELQAALSFFHNTGMILFFADMPQLRDLVIIDPRWLARVLSTILTFKPNFVDRQTARLSLSDLQHVWKPYPAELHPRLLSLLFRFGIAFQLSSSRGALLFPSLLTTKMPSNITHHKGMLFPSSFSRCCFGRLYRFEFLPLGFFARIMVGLLSSPLFDVSFFAQTDSFRLWSDGLLFEWPPESAGIAIVAYDTSSFELQLFVQSNSELAAFRMEAIVDVVESIISGFYAAFANRITRLALCSHCLHVTCANAQNLSPAVSATATHITPSRPASVMPKPTVFSIKECFEAFQDQKALICGRKLPPVMLPLQHVAPDLAFSNITILPPDSLNIMRSIGKGGQGEVWLGTLQHAALGSPEKVFVAVKTLHAHSNDTSSEEVLRLLTTHREVTLMSQLRHPNLVQLYGITLRPLQMVLEYASFGDLYHVLHDTESYSDDVITRLRYRIALDVALGMEYLHELSPPVIHRDLRSPNIFLMRLHSGAPVVAKVADFGLAQSLVIASGITDRLETWQWMAPEAIGMQVAAYTERADVYSFGIIMWELLTRRYPFEEYKQMSLFKLKESISRENSPLRPTIPEPHAGSCFASLVRDCWGADPSARPTFSEVVFQLRSCPADKSSVSQPPSRAPPSLWMRCQTSLNSLSTSETTDQPLYATSLVFVDETRQLWAGCNDGSLQMLDENGRWMTTIAGTKHKARVYGLKEVHAGISHVVISASEDGVVSAWSTSGKHIRDLVYHPSRSIRCLAPLMSSLSSATQDEAAFGDTNGTIELWRLICHPSAPTKLALQKATRLGGSDAVICAICQSADLGIVIGCAGGTLVKLQHDSLKEIHRTVKAHRRRINALIALQGDIVASASDDYTVGLWNYKLDLLHRISVHDGKVHTLARFGDCLLSAGFDLKLLAHSYQTLSTTPQITTAVAVQKVATDSVSALCVFTVSGPNGELVTVACTSSRDGFVKFWIG